MRRRVCCGCSSAITAGGWVDATRSEHGLHAASPIRARRKGAAVGAGRPDPRALGAAGPPRYRRDLDLRLVPRGNRQRRPLPGRYEPDDCVAASAAALPARSMPGLILDVADRSVIADCNRIRVRGEPALMKWLVSLIAGLMMLGQASWSLAQPTVYNGHEPRLACATCCDSERGSCGTGRTACERICSAAIVPASALVPRPGPSLVHSPRQANRLVSRTIRPAPPPPRQAEGKNEHQPFSGELR